MFYEYALIPDIFDPTLLYTDGNADTVVTQILRGIESNGVIASLHKGEWQRHVRALIDKIPSADPERNRASPRGKLQDCLELLDKRNRLVRHSQCPSCPSSDAEWLAAAKRSHAAICFDGIVMCQDLFEHEKMGTCEQAVPLHRALDAKFWVGRQFVATLKEKRKRAFRSVLLPVLRHAKAVTLIDPYIDPSVARWRHIIELVGELTGRRAGIASNASWEARIRIHAGDPTPVSPSTCFADWEKAIATLPRSFRVDVCLWRRTMTGPPPHDRFIITNQFGIVCPGGLDCYRDDDTTSSAANATSTWSMMSFSAMSHHLGEYEQNSSPYELIDSRSFRPSGA